MANTTDVSVRAEVADNTDLDASKSGRESDSAVGFAPALSTYGPRNPVATFENEYGETEIIHRPKGRALKLYRGLNTPVLRMNRAAATLLGQLVRSRRKALGLSLKQLCLRAGLKDANPKQRIHAIETAMRAEGVRLGTLYALAHALECEVGDLLPAKADVIAAAEVTPQSVETLSAIGD